MNKLILGLVFTVVGFAQQAVSNADVVKLTQSGLSEDFILKLIDTQGSQLSTDASSLVQLKKDGVHERVITAITRKSPSREKLNTDSILSLAKAGFTDSFVIDLMARQPGTYNTDASRLVELKQAGLSERVLAKMVNQSGGRELVSGTTIRVRMIDAIDSDKAIEGEQFRASLDEALTISGETVAPRGADAKVRIIEEKDSGKFTGRTELTIQLVSVVVNGQPVAITTSTVSQESGSRGARTAKSAAAVGAVGAVIGAIAGGGKGAAIGAAAGGAAGAGAQVFMKGQRVRIPSETILSFTTNAAVKL